MDIITGSHGVIVISYEHLHPQEVAQIIEDIAANALPLVRAGKVQVNFISCIKNAKGD